MATATESKEIAKEANKHLFTDADLAGVTDMDTALAMLGSVTDIEDFADYGSGFDILENKDNLIGVPFVVLEWRFTDSQKYSQTFASMVVVDEKNNKYIVNDGSTGICAQLQMVTQQRIDQGKAYPQAALICRKGLRRSDYTVEDSQGKELEASTYYLA